MTGLAVDTVGAVAATTPAPGRRGKASDDSLPKQLTIYDLLASRYPSPEWALMREVAPRTGGGTRYADAVAVNLWESRGHAVHGFEVKVSRADWLRELKKPEKAEESVYRYCDYWWVVAPAGIVKDGELPPTWGLIERRGDGLVQKVAAPHLEPRPITRAFFASLMRRGHESVEDRARQMVQASIDQTKSQFEERVEKEVERRSREFTRLSALVEEFQIQTGLRIDRHVGTYPAISTIKIAQRLEKLEGWQSRPDGSLAALAHLASQLNAAAETVRKALSETGFAPSEPDGAGKHAE